MPLILGTTGVLLAGSSLVMIRSRDAEKRFGIGFAIVRAAWCSASHTQPGRRRSSTMAATPWAAFERRMHELVDLGRVGGLLNWDEQVNMPPRGAGARGEAKATLAVLHERICDERFGEAIAELSRRRRARRAAQRRACARRDASAIAPCACPRRSCGSSPRPSPRASRPGRSRARLGLLALPRSARADHRAAARGGRRRRATRAVSATTPCSTSTSRTCASPASSRS